MIVNPYAHGTGVINTVTKRYWRIYVTANNGGAAVSVDRVRFYDGALAQITTTGKTYLESGHYSASYLPDYAFGMTALSTSNTGFWAVSWSNPQYVGIDFGSAVEVGRVDIGFGSGVSTSEPPKDFLLQHSDDGSSWTTWRTESGKTSWSTGNFEQFPIP